MLTRIITGAVALIIFIPVLFFSHTIIFNIAIAVIALAATLEILNCAGVVKKRKNIPAKDIAICFFAIIFIAVSFASIIITRRSENGDILYLLIFIGAWTSDTFAYFTGRLLGRHKLAPVISPKKTIEGAVGGVIFCALAFVLYGFIISNIKDMQPDYILLGVTGLAISVISILGDLAMSAIKRYYGVKDYGAIFPGHGGVLDRFDSVMAAALLIMVLGFIGGIFECYQ